MRRRILIRKENPWSEISVPRADYAVRRVPDCGSTPVYWGRDSAGHYILVIELDGDYAQDFKKEAVAVRGIKVDLRQFGTSSEQGLVVTLEEQVNSDLFLGLCNTMISSLRPVEDSASALAVAVAHIKRWKAFLAGKKPTILSPEEIRGLFAELHFLEYLLDEMLPEKEALEAWQGPEGSHQDFLFGNTAVEIKALSGKERNTVRISSEDQLEAVDGNLYLTVYGLRESQNARGSSSLIDRVTAIRGKLTDAESVEEFFRRLGACGYVELEAYSKPQFIVTSRRAFQVVEGFPRLIRSELPEGLARVKYEIELERLQPFEVEMKSVGE